MNRIIVAFGKQTLSEQVKAMLESSGITVRYCCRSGGEATRRVREMGGGIVVCGYKLSDMTASDMAYDICGEALVLVVAAPEQLENCAGDSFTIPAPVSRAELAAVVRMLEQLEEQRVRATVPQRTDEERAVVEDAKAALMNKHHITEEEAHRYIQQRSMASGRKMADTARMVLELCSSGQ